MLALLALLACAPDDDAALDEAGADTADTADTTASEITRDEFIAAYVELDCIYAQTCGEAGYESVEACEVDRTPRWESWLACPTWDAPLAELCLDAMAMLVEEPCGTQVNTESCTRLRYICENPDY